MKRIVCTLMAGMLLLILFVGSVCALEPGFVTDDAELLTHTQWQMLEQECAEIAEEYGCGVYVITLEECGEDPYDLAAEFFDRYSLGVGSEENGVVLLLGIEDRSVGLFVHGDDAEYTIDEYGALMLEEEYLPYLEKDAWYDALNTYVLTCKDYLQQAEEGNPVRGSDAPIYLIAILVSFVISLIVCLILRTGMKNVRIKQEAGAYIASGLNLTARTDRFTHKTETRTKIEKQSSTAQSGGGGHGRSSKF